jgi:SAM-dependent methyltransferase
MGLTTTADVLDLLDASFPSAAVGAALELGLFWMIDERPRSAPEIAAALGIPSARCVYWLQLLEHAGLLERGPEGFARSPVARTAIVQAFSRETWAFLALEARERLPVLVDLALSIREGGPLPAALQAPRPGYVETMSADTGRARRFTRMLEELHRPLAEELAGRIDARGVTRVLDLGGGSGVVSLALARRNPGLTAVVVDIPAVCEAGREIAATSGLADRVTYQPADILRDDLPRPFGLAVMCDVGVYSEKLFRRVAAVMDCGGRFVIADVFAPAPGVAPPSRVHWLLERSLSAPRFAIETAGDVEAMLQAAGFRVLSRETMDPPGAEAGHGDLLTILCAAVPDE